MRDIKFRAWDEINHKMRQISELNLRNGYVWCPTDTLPTCLRCPTDTLPTCLHGDSFKLMQYTGLKDKNGKEIYEGDITNYGVVEWNDHLNWDSGGSNHPGFYFKEGCEYREDGALSYHIGFNTNIVVIGNIYENPELLKES